MRSNYFIWAIFFTASLVNADSLYTSKENWGFYLDACNDLAPAMEKVESQMKEKYDAPFTSTVLRAIERMELTLADVLPKDRIPKKISDCDAVVVKANVLLKKASAYEQQVKLRQQAEYREWHESQPVYKQAINRGYKDYSWISALYSDYREHGEEKISEWVFLVDNDCGRYYRVIQYLKPYYIYLATKGRYSTCNGKDRIAVLPHESQTIQKGSFINKKSYFEFAGVLDATGNDGFPIQLPILKQFISESNLPNKAKQQGPSAGTR